VDVARRFLHACKFLCISEGCDGTIICASKSPSAQGPGL